MSDWPLYEQAMRKRMPLPDAPMPLPDAPMPPHQQDMDPKVLMRALASMAKRQSPREEQADARWEPYANDSFREASLRKKAADEARRQEALLRYQR